MTNTRTVMIETFNSVPGQQTVAAVQHKHNKESGAVAMANNSPQTMHAV